MYNSRMEAVDRALDILGGFSNSYIKAYREAHTTGFTIVDLRVAYKFTPKIKLSLIGANLLNQEYTYRPALLEAPRNVQMRLDWTL